MPLIEALKRCHATFCGFHGYPRPWLEKWPYLAEYLANRLGYWYFLDGAQIPESVSGFDTIAKFYFTNKGFCHSYYPFKFKIKIVGENGSFDIFSELGINQRIMAESSYEYLVKLDFKKVPAGKYLLCVGMFENDLAIKLGFKNDCLMSDGYYCIDEIFVRGE